MRYLSDCTKRLVTILALSTVLSFAGAGLSAADGFFAEPVSVALRVPKAFHVRHQKFDWLAKRAPIAVVQQVRFAADRANIPRQIGTGSYICSPAGFGHRSRCYAN